MLTPEIGTITKYTYCFTFPCQDDTEDWSFEFEVEIHRISRGIFDYYWKEHALGKGQGRTSQQTRWYGVKMIISRRLYQIAFTHALEWSDMDFERDGSPVIPVPELSTSQVPEC